MLNRSGTTKALPINIAGSSTFGRYPKISVEKTYNMFISDNWLVDYAGYQAVSQNSGTVDLGNKGRGIFASTTLGKIVAVYDASVYLINVVFDEIQDKVIDFSSIVIGSLSTSSGPVFIDENAIGQIALCDQVNVYIYDQTKSPAFEIAQIQSGVRPGYICYHDSRFMISDLNSVNWYISPEDAYTTSSPWTAIAAQGAIQTKADKCQAVVRMPSGGNSVFVMGKVVTESWFDTGSQNFPYQRSNTFTIDYGCINPATIAYTDKYLVWLAQNEKSGPIILYTNGGEPTKITTDGIDYLFGTLEAPEDSRAFMYRQDGHLFYHINFYTDNLSLIYDFNTGKFYHACDENGNYFIADQICFFKNQYYFVSRNNGNFYILDTKYTTFDGKEIPRIRICKWVALPSQEYFIANDVGFTIETGKTPYQVQNGGPEFLLTESGLNLITESNPFYLVTESQQQLITESGNNLVTEQSDPTNYNYLITEQGTIVRTVPRVDLSISNDGGESFSSELAYNLNPQGKGRNKLLWWGLGASNNLVCQFKFWGLGRFVATDGLVNIRQ